MIKLFFKLTFLLIILGNIFSGLVFAEGKTISSDNVLIKAFEERKKMVFDFISGGELKNEINNLEKNINGLDSGRELSEDIKSKLLKDIEKLKSNIELQLENTGSFDKIKSTITEAEQSIKIKENLVTKLNEEIEENNLNKEKVALLLKKSNEQKAIMDLKNSKSEKEKYYLFMIISSLLLLIYGVVNFLSKRGKINKNKTVYINFFLIFGFIIFIVWFFFYLHPELLVFIIFISGYLLAINAHLIASFVGSLLILEKYKIGDVINYGDFRGQIIKITTLNTILLPVTKEGIFSDKPILVPNVDILKNTIIKDKEPEVYLHEYCIKVQTDLGLDIIQLVESIENNILKKHISYRLNSLAGSEDTFRTSIGFDNLGKILITFVWRGDDILNKRIERKTIGLFTKFLKTHQELKEEELLEKGLLEIDDKGKEEEEG